MNLRVFSDGNGLTYVEISSQGLPNYTKIFVPFITSDGPDAQDLQEDLTDNVTVPIQFGGISRIACVLLVSNLDIREHNLKPIGFLEEEDSRRILNHFLDILAYRD